MRPTLRRPRTDQAVSQSSATVLYVRGRYPEERDYVNVERIEAHEDPAARLRVWQQNEAGEAKPILDLHVAIETTTVAYAPVRFPS